MPNIKIGSWYQSPGGQAFEVVAIEGDDSIEIQYAEGEIEELDIETWEQMFLLEVNPPEDWTAAYDGEDLGYSDTVLAPENPVGMLHAFETEN